MDPSITEHDMQEMRGFPLERKATLVQQISAREPDVHRRFSAAKDFEQALVKLRRHGFVLVDFQVKGNTRTSLWYRKGDALLLSAARRPEVTMLVQEEGAKAAQALSWWL